MFLGGCLKLGPKLAVSCGVGERKITSPLSLPPPLSLVSLWLLDIETVQDSKCQRIHLSRQLPETV